MSSKSDSLVIKLPFLDELFQKSPLCQICEFGSYGIGGVCTLLLNRKVPTDLVIQENRVVSCSAYRNWIDCLENNS